MQQAEELLSKALVAEDVFKLRLDYRALLIVVDNIPTGPSDNGSESLLVEAETTARSILAKSPTVDIPHIAAWRDAYKAFGAKPTKTRNSVEALTRRLEKPDGKLPRINRLTDIYNAISVKHHIPIGGEDFSKYVGAPVLIRATGEERFEAFAGGKADVEHPDKGEIIWCDDVGVTCRRWNWRQGPRTALNDESTKVLFIMDALSPLSDDALMAAANELVNALKAFSPDLKETRKVLRANK